jgi:hypothetical protein
VGFDATHYTGFSLWVAAGETALPPLELPLGVMTRDTSGGSGLCGVACGDYYRKSIPLTTSLDALGDQVQRAGAERQQGAPQLPAEQEGVREPDVLARANVRHLDRRRSASNPDLRPSHRRAAAAPPETAAPSDRLRCPRIGSAHPAGRRPPPARTPMFSQLVAWKPPSARK